MYFKYRQDFAATTCFCIIIISFFSNNVLANRRGVFYTPVDGDNSGFTERTKIYDKSYAVIIGINDYEILPDLRGAVKDALSIESELKEQGFETFVLLDKNATRSAIARLLGDQLSKKVKKNDRVFVFFAGHGVSTGNGDSAMGYLMPTEGEQNSPRATGISMDEMQSWFADYSSKHVMFVADACYSGLALSTRSSGLSINTQEYLKQVTSKNVRIALVAGGRGEEANEYQGHGLFTMFFLEALNGAADSNGDGVITSAEIAAFIAPNVITTAMQKFRSSQTPQLGRRGEGEFVFLSPLGAKTRRGAIVVTSNPLGAKIHLDNNDTGFRTPHTIAALEAGPHDVYVSLNGNSSQRMTVHVQPSVETPVTLNISEQSENEHNGLPSVAPISGMGRVTVSAFDTETNVNLHASVFIDDTPVGTTEYSGILPEGSHNVKIFFGNSPPFLQTVFVSHNSHVRVRAPFLSASYKERDSLEGGNNQENRYPRAYARGTFQSSSCACPKSS